MQHVCELILTIQLFPSDTNLTTGTGQDGMAMSNTSYIVSPLDGGSPCVYTLTVLVLLHLLGAYLGAYAANYMYAPPINVYTSNNVYSSPLTAARNVQ